jgi:hypothetical protein
MKATSGMQFMRRSRTPVTLAIIVLSVGVFVLSWLLHGKLFLPLSFATNWSRPWGLITYPFADQGIGTGLFWFLLELYWLYWVGCSVESELGPQKYGVLFAVSSASAALFIWLGFAILFPGVTGIVASLSLPIAALTVIWGIRHRSEIIQLMFVIPVPGWILAWLTVALTLFGFGTIYGAPLMGMFACLHLGLAYLYATNRIPNLAYGRAGGRTERQAYKRTEKLDRSYYDNVKAREKERAEREQLRKLFENSMKDDDKPK